MIDKVDKVDKTYDTSDRYARNDTEATHNEINSKAGKGRKFRIGR